jgi:hypothetical protein
MKIPFAALVHVLVGKSIAEALLVGALAVFAYVAVLPPHFHGWGELTDTGIAGWAVNNAKPWERVEVQLFLDGAFAATEIANLTRPDVVGAGWAKDEWHGYSFRLAALNVGEHEARVYALHDAGDGRRKSLQLLGEPVRFSVDTSGKLQLLRQVNR